MTVFELNGDAVDAREIDLREILQTLKFFMHLDLVMGLYLTSVWSFFGTNGGHVEEELLPCSLSCKSTFCLCLTLASKVHPDGWEFGPWFNSFSCTFVVIEQSVGWESSFTRHVCIALLCALTKPTTWINRFHFWGTFSMCYEIGLGCVLFLWNIPP